MANINDVFSGTYLTARDLNGAEPVVTIESVELKELKDGKKLDIGFVGKQKHLLANKTNSKRIAYMFGDETDVWIGKKVQLYTEMVDFQGNVVEAIRVRPAKSTPVAAPQKPFNGTPAARRPAAEFNDSVDDIGETF